MRWPRRRSNSRISSALTGLSSARRICRPLRRAALARFWRRQCAAAGRQCGGSAVRQRHRRGVRAASAKAAASAAAHCRHGAWRRQRMQIQPLEQRDFAHRLDQIAGKAHRACRSSSCAARRGRQQHQGGHCRVGLDQGIGLGVGAGIDQDGVDLAARRQMQEIDAPRRPRLRSAGPGLRAASCCG